MAKAINIDGKWKGNVRFWVFMLGSKVRLTLAPGEELVWGYAGPTDEGSRSHSQSWWYDADEQVVVWEIQNWERDCDGVTEDNRAFRCPVERLQADWQGGTPMPQWQLCDKMYRDHTAEAAGY